MEIPALVILYYYKNGVTKNVTVFYTQLHYRVLSNVWLLFFVYLLHFSSFKQNYVIIYCYLMPRKRYTIRINMIGHDSNLMTYKMYYSLLIIDKDSKIGVVKHIIHAGEFRYNARDHHRQITYLY